MSSRVTCSVRDWVGRMKSEGMSLETGVCHCMSG